MIIKFETETDKGFKRGGGDGVCEAVVSILRKNYGEIEALYLNRRYDGNIYDGTAHWEEKEIGYIEISEGKMFFLPESQRKGFRKGKRISECPRAIKFSF